MGSRKRKSVNLRPQPGIFTIEEHDNPQFLNDENTPSPDVTVTAVTQLSDICKLPELQNGAQLSSKDVETKIEVSKTSESPALKKSINLLNCTAIMVAVTGHAAVFISPTSILASTGSIGASLGIWLLGGLINMGLALCFAELGTMLPDAGGLYAFVLRMFGPLTGFIVVYGYMLLLAAPVWALLAYTAALYIVKPVFPHCEAVSADLGVKLLAAWIIITVVVLNCTFMKVVTKVQTLLASMKILALLLVVGSGIAMLAKGETENFENIFEGTSHDPGDLAMAVFYGVFSFGGWQVMSSLSEELKNPGRDMPLSVHLTFIVVITKYIMTNVAYFTLITPSEMLQSNAVALLYVQRLYSPMSPLVCVLVAATCIGALNANVMGHSRMLFAAARIGQMPLVLGMIHHDCLTPWPAIAFIGGLSLVMLFIQGISSMMMAIGFIVSSTGLMVVVALLYLRWTKPDDIRPYKVSLFVPVIEVFVITALLVIGIYKRPREIGITIGILATGIPVYWVGVLWRNKPPEMTAMIEWWTISIQKIFMVLKA